MAESDNFKKTFKYYKSKLKTPDLSRVVNLTEHDPQKQNFKIFKQNLDLTAENNENLLKLGLKEASKWKIYQSNINEGLIYIINPFTSSGQRYWIEKCYLEYPKAPNVTNLDQKTTKTQQNLHTKQLRWVTLGYHHNWDTKVYSLDHYTPFPIDLKSLTEFLAQILGFPKYKAEAAIVNFYHLNSTLAGHVDKSEFDLNAPLFSISFGLPAIFLLGGRTRNEEPSAILLNSGDIIIMSGLSRLSYHAIPKILPLNQTPWLEDEKTEWNSLKNIINESRINLNIRQVFNHK